MQILVIEDDVNTIRNLTMGLHNAEFTDKSPMLFPNGFVLDFYSFFSFPYL